MTPYTTPDMQDAELNTIARNIGAATHVSLDRTNAPMLGQWVRDWRDDWGVTEAEPGIRPVGWVTVNTRKRGPVVVWCDSWRLNGRRMVAGIGWPRAEYLALTDAQLEHARELAVEHADDARRNVGQGHRWGARLAETNRTLSNVMDEVSRRMFERVMRAGTREAEGVR